MTDKFNTPKGYVHILPNDKLEEIKAEAHQAGIDEAVQKIFTWGCGNSLVVPFEDGRPLDVVEWSKLKEIIKALTYNK